MNAVTEWLNALELRASLEGWVNTQVLVLDNVIQVGLIVLALLVGQVVGPRLRQLIETLSESRPWRADVQIFVARVAAHSNLITMVILLWTAAEVESHSDLFDNHLTRTVASLVNAWVVIRLISGVIRNEVVARFIAWTAWSLAALTTLGWFDGAIALLDAMAMTFGEVRVSVLTVVKGVVALGLLLWVTMSVSSVLERRISRADSLTPSVRVLVAKLTKIVLIALALLIAINTLGIDLTALTVFGGALGVGIGFGLQKIVANLMSGLTLLMDKSIKPNDVIAVGGTYGWIVSLGARYAAVRTRDGIEHLIPNEELITQRVENWTHSDKAMRLKIPVRVSYNCDVRLAMRQCVEAAIGIDRVLGTPKPRCLLMSFGDSSVDLQIRLWIEDPQEGRSNVISQVLLSVWDRFHEHGIEIPFPQHDLHLKSSDVRLGITGVEQSGRDVVTSRRRTPMPDPGSTWRPQMTKLEDYNAPEECWLNIDPHPSIDGYVYHDYGPYQEGECSFRYVREDLIGRTPDGSEEQLSARGSSS